jgi:TolB-like protein/Tfp pilus assembly protein PilF
MKMGRFGGIAECELTVAPSSIASSPEIEGARRLADVFISYARSDKATATRVAKGLQGAGYDVWWDADLPAHRAYSEIIERNLEESRAVVVLWSKAAAQSQWVRAEADFARNAGKLVQAGVDGSTPPLPFNQIQCAELKGWRGNAANAGWAKLRASVQALVSGERAEAKPVDRRLRDRIRARRWPVAGGLALVIAAMALLFFLGVPGEERKPVLAVLPFHSLAAQDENLVAGMWEDTRQAIGRNPQLIVLGPNSAEQLAEKGEVAARKAADFLLHASVRTAGDKIRVSADLVRTSDGEQLWSQDFDRELDDVFALQSEIASEIEGRIRGRLARKGGVMPEHIATSGEVYALYNDARAKIRKRDFGDQAHDAWMQLKEVIRRDPNFAPGWAALAEVDRFVPPSRRGWATVDRAEEYARKAIDLAPNLAAGHAALAFALNFDGPVARSAIERAVQLDPNDFEAMSWLGNTRSRTGDKKGALEAYARAVDIEPFFWPAVFNKYSILKQLGDRKGMADLIAHEQRVGADHLARSIRIDQALSDRNLARALNLGLEYWASGKKEGRTVIGLSMAGMLLQLGFVDEAAELGGPVPDFAPLLWRNDNKGLDMLEAKRMDARTLFALAPLTENAGRVYVLSGRSAKLAGDYLSLKLAPAEYAKLGDAEHFLDSAPIVAIALQRTGHADKAADLLAHAEGEAKRAAMDGTPAGSVRLARVYAAQGRNDEAMPLLAGAIARGWLPQPPVLQVDLANDPALAALNGDARFEKLRAQVLGTIARQRALVDLDLLRRAVAAN